MSLKYVLITTVLLIGAWYGVDGRYVYQVSGNWQSRIDRVTGETCNKLISSASPKWGCNTY